MFSMPFSFFMYPRPGGRNCATKGSTGTARELQSATARVGEEPAADTAATRASSLVIGDPAAVPGTGPEDEAEVPGRGDHVEGCPVREVLHEPALDHFNRMEGQLAPEGDQLALGGLHFQADDGGHELEQVEERDQGADGVNHGADVVSADTGDPEASLVDLNADLSNEWMGGHSIDTTTERAPLQGP